MKNVQVRDGADNATLSIFRATEREFAYLFPGEGQDMELIEDFIARHHPHHVAEVLQNLWLRPVHKSKAAGIHGTLFFNYADQREHLPASKREIDRDPSQLNPAERQLYAAMEADEIRGGDSPLPAMTAALLEDVPGGRALLDWFGGEAPSFHDAEVLAISLDRARSSCELKIHAFQMTPDVDTNGFYVLDKHVVVSFRFEDITNLELEDFNGQNVINGLSISRTASHGFRLELDPCYGVFGFFEAAKISIELAPGKPKEGVHSS